MTDINKVVKWSGEYYPYGELYNETVSKSSELRFPGQLHDRETELYYNWHRYYDPSVGRYTQADPIGLAGGLNMYAYANNNPGLLLRKPECNGIPIHRSRGRGHARVRLQLCS